MPTGSAAAGMTPSTGAKHSQPPPLPHSTSATAAAAAATGARVLGRAAPLRSALPGPGRRRGGGSPARPAPPQGGRGRGLFLRSPRCGVLAAARAGGTARQGLDLPGGRAERSGVRPRWRSCAWGASGPARLAGRTRRPGGRSPWALGSRARGGRVEDARDPTAMVHFSFFFWFFVFFSNGLPAAWWMDGWIAHLLSPGEAGRYARVCVIFCGVRAAPVEVEVEKVPGGIGLESCRGCVYFWKSALS
uniref:Uncharacterized protein n=1 Tax=Myotis myotis TaxID=51298 RepID=A0A7J7XZX2_MYOMY|nr:hypothetical protein mMyoMyo1_011315 [Myotis myotis]